MMKAEIITIGDEILNGQIVDTNSAWIAQQLAPLQIPIVQITSIADVREDIAEALHLASERATVIIVTGGLGPTKDDVTKETLAQYFQTHLVRNEEVLSHVRNLFLRFGYADMPAMNVHQADVLANAEVLFNDVGTAPGMWVAQDGRYYVFLPGVPFEMKYLMENRVLARLENVNRTQTIIHNTYVLTVGIGESHLAERIADVEAQLPKHIHLAYLPQIGLVKLRLTAQGRDEQRLREECDLIAKAIQGRVGDHVIAFEDLSFEQVIIARFKAQELHLSTAESCTGGYISSLITAVSGASAMFNGGAVVYSNEAKHAVLGVDPEVIQQHGAVSEQTVRQMAEGARRVFRTDYAIATSGIAGPDGGTAEKPVGTVWVAVAGRQETVAKVFHFKNDRQVNIERSAKVSLQLLWDLFQKELKIKSK